MVTHVTGSPIITVSRARDDVDKQSTRHTRHGPTSGGSTFSAPPFPTNFSNFRQRPTCRNPRKSADVSSRDRRD
jgi:hypothetical protein